MRRRRAEKMWHPAVSSSSSSGELINPRFYCEDLAPALLCGCCSLVFSNQAALVCGSQVTMYDCYLAWFKGCFFILVELRRVETCGGTLCRFNNHWHKLRSAFGIYCMVTVLLLSKYIVLLRGGARTQRQLCPTTTLKCTVE